MLLLLPDLNFVRNESSVRYLDDTRDFKFFMFFPSYVLWYLF